MAKTLATKTPISRKRRKIFLEILAVTGNVTKASEAVGYTSSQYMHKIRRDDEGFAEDWDEAINAFCDRMEEEATRRGHDGVLKAVWYKGEIVGYDTLYSDTLLLAMLRANRPEKFNQQQGGGLNVNFGVAVLPMQAQSDSAWEQRAVTMHEGQHIITLEEKPKENVLEQRAGVARGD